MAVNKPNLEQLLNSEDVNNSIITLDEYISDLSNLGDNIELLSGEQKVFFFNQIFEREVNHGGFEYFFWNSSGNFVHEVLESLKQIGANKTLGLLQAAINEFPGGKVPTDINERQSLIEKIEDEANPKWDVLFNSFLEYEDDLNALNFEFIKQNKNSF